jgi:hypothetical protein
MWDYIKTNKIIVISSILIIILFISLIIQWFNSRKIKHKIIHMDKQIYSLGKSQLYLEKTIKKLLQVKPSLPQPPIILEPSPQLILDTQPTTSFVFSSPKKVSKVHDEPKILEIDDSESEKENIVKNDDDTDSDDETPFDDKTLDLELKNELNELN